MGNILIFGEDKTFTHPISGWLKEDGHEILVDSNPDLCVWLTYKFQTDILIVDVPACPSKSEPYWKMIGEYLDNPSLARIIVVGELLEAKKAASAIRQGALDCFEKPGKTDEEKLTSHAMEKFKERLRTVIDSAIQRSNGNGIIANLERQNIIGNSAELKSCLITLSEASVTNEPILITGETGTGKELFARAAHQNSPRRDRAFVAFNSAAIPESLAESELFGHEKGSFSGAATRRIGRFEQAHQGTIFLDEIGDLSLALQGKLLRILQEKTLERVGSNQTIPVDVRVIAATNRNLEEAIRTGMFREDLYYRINTFTIHIPPLRDRREDIKAIVQYIVGESGKKYTMEFMSALEGYEWPGNVRQLRSELESSFARAQGAETLNIYHLSNEIRARWIENGGYRIYDLSADKAIQDKFPRIDYKEIFTMTSEIPLDPSELDFFHPQQTISLADRNAEEEFTKGSESDPIDIPLKIKDYVDQAQEKYIRQLLKWAKKNKVTIEDAAKKAGMSPQKLHRLKQKYHLSKK